MSSPVLTACSSAQSKPSAVWSNRSTAVLPSCAPADLLFVYLHTWLQRVKCPWSKWALASVCCYVCCLIWKHKTDIWWGLDTYTLLIHSSRSAITLMSRFSNNIHWYCNKHHGSADKPYYYIYILFIDKKNTYLIWFYFILWEYSTWTNV